MCSDDTDKMKHESSIVGPELNYHHNKEKEAKLYEDDVPLLLHPDARPFRRLHGAREVILTLKFENINMQNA